MTPVEVARARPGERVEDALLRAASHELVSLLGERLASATRVSFACDGERLALRALVVSEPPLLVRVGARHGPVYEDECVELFVSEPAEPSRYLEVVVNPLGTVYAARVVNPDGDRRTWSIERGVEVAGLRVEVGGDAPEPALFTRWTATITVPWSAVGGAPHPGDERRGNVTRIARGRTTRFEALSPTLRASPPDFHVPERFARLLFT